MSLAIRRDEQPWIVGAVLAIGTALATVWAALIGRRANVETEYYRNLSARVADLEAKVETLLSELDQERREVLALTFERDGLLRENHELLQARTEQAGRILELESEVARLKSHRAH